MIASIDLWHAATSLLFVTLLCSTVILIAAVSLNRLVTKLSADMRCRIWILSLMACFLPAMFISVRSVGNRNIHPTRGTKAAVETKSADAESRIDVSPKSNSTERTANEPITITRTTSSAPTEPVAEAERQFGDTQTNESSAGDIATVNSITEFVTSSPSRVNDSQGSGKQWELPEELCRAVVIGWMSIASLLVFRLIVNVVRSTLMWRLRLRDPKTADLKTCDFAQFCKERHAGLRNVQIRMSDAITVPVVTGLLSPIIVLPTAAIDWPASQLKLVMQHELAHIHRSDIFWNCFVSLIRAVIWFQPLAWIVQRRLRDDQEFACDDAVLLEGNDGPDYATILIRIAESVSHRRQSLISSVAMANGHSVERRIRSILDASRNRQESRWQRFTYLIGVALTLLQIVFFSVAWTPELALANSDVDSSSTPATTSSPAAVKPDIDEKSPESSVDDNVYRFRHRVVDVSGAPVSAAVVTISSRSFTVEPATTNADGWCELAVPSGSEFTPASFTLRAVSKDGEQIAIQKGELKDKRLLYTGRGMLMPTWLQKVQVIDSQENPIVDAVVGTVMAEDILDVSKTDATGIALVRRLPGDGRVFALKDGAGFDFTNLKLMDTKTGENESVTLTLNGARPIAFRVVTPTGFSRSKSNTLFSDFGLSEEEEKKYIEKLEPLEGVGVLPEWISRSDGSFNTSMFLDSPLMEDFCPKTNSMGEATIRWMPKSTSMMWPFGFAGKGLCSNERTIEADDVDEIHQVVVDRLVEIQGRVVDGNGKPVAGSVVRVSGKNWDLQKHLSYNEHGVSSDSYNVSLISEADGRFSMFVPPRQDLLFLVEGPGQVSHTQVRAIFPLKSPLNVELSFGGRNQISGLLTSGTDRTPLADRLIDLTYVSSGEQFSEFIDAEHRNWGLAIPTQVRTDKHGRYSLQVGDGEWRLKDPFKKREENSITVKGGFQVQKNFHSDDKTLLRTTIVSAKTQQEERGTVDISGVTQFLQNGQLPVVSRRPHFVEATSPSGKAFTVWDGQSDEFRIFVAPVVTAHGQLVDENGTPLANRSIRYMILPSVPKGAKLTKKYDYGNSGSISTDEQGKFTLTNFIQGCECQVMATNDEDIEWAKKKWQILKSVVPNSDDAIDLGKLAFSQATPGVK